MAKMKTIRGAVKRFKTTKSGRTDKRKGRRTENTEEFSSKA